MSKRGSKRATGSRPEDQPGPSGLSSGLSGAPSTSKRRRTEPEDAQWHLRQANDLKMSSIYNRSASEAPAELFRKDLISAMKLPDNEPLTPSEYWVITDPWKQEWERGVQVPVNPDSLPAPKVKIIDNPKPPDHIDFKLPKDKYIHLSRDSNYQSDKHQLSSTPACAEAACSYDLDATDTSWLKLLNAERARAGSAPITEEQLEKVIEELEVRTWDKIQAIMKSEEGLGIEYDENVICDVCRSPDSEDGNEMVFCDSCNICVHQACYGITVIPDGQWLCRPCGDSVKPTCVLCPNLGGAMKCTPSGHKWAHVSCVLWIPEVSIGCAEKMEPITKISSIPSSRWSLVCVLCRERKGACIQCSVKSCKTAYHVTCAFKHGLEMRAIIEDENADDGVKLRSYCQKHSVNSKKEKCPGSGSEEEEVKRKRRKDMTSEEKTQARTARLHEIEKEFDKHVSIKDISSHLLDVDQDAINYMYHYWKLKRRSGHNRPLLPPKSDDSELMSHRQEQADLDKMKMFVQLRQDLERVRNLCYMVSRREKLSRSFFRQREQTFHKQVAVLSSGVDIPKEEMDAIIEANHGPSIYDRLYSHPGAADHKSNFEALLSKIAPHRAESGDDKKKDRNGLARRSKGNPYKKHYVNGTRRSGSGISGISSEESESEITRNSKYRSRAIGSSTDDDGDPKKKNSTSPKKKISPKAKPKKVPKAQSPKKNDRKKKKVPQSKAMVESSTEDDSPTRSSKRDKLAGLTKKEPVPGVSGVSKKDKHLISGSSGTSKKERLNSTSAAIKKEKDLAPTTPVSNKKDKDSASISGNLKRDRLHSISENIKEKELGLSSSGAVKKEKEPTASASTALKKEKEAAPSTSGKKEQSVSKTLRQMEKEMAAGRYGISGSDSDDLDLVPIRTTRSVKFPVDIYSTSSDESSSEIKSGDIKDKSEKGRLIKSPSNDSQQSFRTKGAMKEFVHAEKKEQQEEEKPAPKKRGRKPSNNKKPPVVVKSELSEDESRGKDAKHSKQNDHPGIVPQRQAAKKASENMRSTTSGKKEDTGAPERPPEDLKGKSKGKGKGKEIKSPPVKMARKSSKDEKDTIAYVPQRQAAKKAAAHIKNIGSKVPAPETVESVGSNKKKEDKSDSKSSDELKRKSISKDSSSSSSCSSSSSSCSSSSDEVAETNEKAAPGPKPAAKAREIKPIARIPSMFSPPGSRPILDLPFLDKVSRPLSSTSASSDTESSQSDRSGSISPTPKRPRRRRKGKSTSNDVSPRKAPDKKLKTSERDSECGDSSAAAQREEPARAARARSRSATAGGDLLDSVHAGPREPDAAAAGAPLTPTSGASPPSPRQPGQLPPAERPPDASTLTTTRTTTTRTRTCTMEGHDHEEIPLPPNEPPLDDKHKLVRPEKMAIKIELDSPKRTPEPKQKSISERRANVIEEKEIHPMPTEESPRDMERLRRQSRYEALNSILSRSSGTPLQDQVPPAPPPLPPDPPPPEPEDKKGAIIIDEDYNDNNKHWLPKAPSPTVVPPQIEKPGGHDKYMAEDRTFEAECTEKSSVKMIAKIQANLNENTMIKSPRTPMDARSVTIDSIETENSNIKNMKKRTAIDIAQDASQIQGVEISKSAKIPSTVNPYPNRSMFSPQQKDNELFAFDMMAVDDGFNHDDDLMKPFSSYPEFFFKEDSKEQGVQETLNLVDRLRMQLSTKKPPTENSSQDQGMPTNDLIDYREGERLREAHQNELERRNESMEITRQTVALEHRNHLSQHTVSHHDLPRPLLMQENDYHHPIPMTSNDKWAPMHLTHDMYMERDQRSYDHNEQYMSEIKEPSTVQSELTSGDTMSLSKQSDDSSQPSVLIVDNSTTTTTIDVEGTQDSQVLENNNCVVSASSPNAYLSQEKWHESKMIATRRSSGSSSSSASEIGAAAADRERALVAAHAGLLAPDLASYPPVPAYSCAVEPSMPLNQYTTYPPSASPFLSRMGSLFGAAACAPLQLPSPSPLFTPYSSAPLLPRQLCAAAFTSSSQNIALTTAMIAPPTPKPIDSPNNDIDVTETDKFSINLASSSISIGSYENSRAAKPSNESSEPPTGIRDLQESSQRAQKSPPKSSVPPPKAHLRYSGKSPGKSPGISPRQGDAKHSKRNVAKPGNRNARGRGRSKSRSSAHSYASDNSIQSKLVGTVYDFEEELTNDSVDLKALRDRRKSIDVREDRRSEHSLKDTSRSPHLHNQLPMMEPPSPPESPCPVQTIGAMSGFGQVSAVLPGPVDMRTYQPLEAPPPPPPPPPPAPEPLPVAPVTQPAPAPAPMPVPLTVSEPRPQDLYLPKVSLSDSRNQLKVKIKGPFLDANYSSSVPTVVVPPPAAALDPPVANVLNVSGVGASCMSGSTNLRRMRKKELLRQYWTQDMNMDATTMGAVPPPAQPSPLARAVITIPKAVASMTSIPTRDDYKVTDPPVEPHKKQKRNVSSGLSRELRHLKVTMNDDVDPSDDVKLSSLLPPPQAKKRARLAKPPPPPASATGAAAGTDPPLAPKLKIKLGSNTHAVQQVPAEPADARPPKKRAMPQPSFEDLRRESMKFRKMVMADFEENEKSASHKHKLSKSERRQKKKDKKALKKKALNNESDSSSNKLVIKIKLPVDPNARAEGSGSAAAAAAAAVVPEPAVDPIDHYDPSALDPLAIDTPSYAEATSALRKVRTAKVTPIRLKVARSTQGTSYVMQSEPGAAAADSESAVAPAPGPAPAPAAPDKHSDVR